MVLGFLGSGGGSFSTVTVSTPSRHAAEIFSMSAFSGSTNLRISLPMRRSIRRYLASSFSSLLRSPLMTSTRSSSTCTLMSPDPSPGMAATPADVKELPGAYAFVVDMPGLGSGDIKVQVEDERVLVISGERRREEKEDAKYLRMERRMGKMMRKFVLPENADMEKISAVCRDGVLTVSLEKLPPPETKKPKTIQVQVA
uniref:SHSP domain-containing protein n=1 Tax=Aegilops tauschii subsp. strangulata TaxID=200361 RepID=A0A453E7M3_AEGTS